MAKSTPQATSDDSQSAPTSTPTATQAALTDSQLVNSQVDVGDNIAALQDGVQAGSGDEDTSSDDEEGRLVWTGKMEQILLENVALQIDLNNHRDGQLKPQAREDVMSNVSRQAKRSVSWKQCRTKLLFYKALYAAFVALEHESGFGINHDTGTITADSFVWKDYLAKKVHKNAKPLRDHPMPHVALCATIYGNKTATGNASKGGASAAKKRLSSKANKKANKKAKSSQSKEPVSISDNEADKENLPPARLQKTPLETAQTPAKQATFQDEATQSQDIHSAAKAPVTSINQKGPRGGAIRLADAITQGLIGMRPDIPVKLALNNLNDFNLSYELYRACSKAFHDKTFGDFEARSFCEGSARYRRVWLRQIANENGIEEDIESDIE